MMQQSSKRLLFFLGGIHAIYFLAAYFLKGIYLIDSYGYLMQAENIKAYGTWYAETWNAPLLIDYFSIRPPLYAWFINSIGLFSNSKYLVLFVQNILSIFNCWLIYTIVKKRGATTETSYLFMIAALLFYPAQLIHANFVMTEILFQSFLLLLFINTLNFLELPNWKNSWYITLLLSVCLLTKPISLFLPLIVLGFMLWPIFHNKGKWFLATPLLLVCIVFHCICLQNKHATGYYHYSSIKSINQLKYNARYTLVNAKGEAYADSLMTLYMQQANSYKSYEQRLQFMDAKALEILYQYPIEFIQLYTKGMVAFFLDPGRFDVYHFFAIEEKGTLGLMYEIQTKGFSAFIPYIKQSPLLILLFLALNFCWNVFVFVCLIKFIFARNVVLPFRLLVFMFVFYIAAATGPVGVSRYRVPVYPFLLMSVLFVSQKFMVRNTLHNA